MIPSFETLVILGLPLRMFMECYHYWSLCARMIFALICQVDAKPSKIGYYNDVPAITLYQRVPGKVALEKTRDFTPFRPSFICMYHSLSHYH